MKAKKIYKVLVVDDEELVVEVLRELLTTSLPYTIVTTTDPAKAIQILKMWEIAVVLCDLNMPEIDGLTVLSQAREANPDIVSILISGIADQESIIRAINDCGVWKFVAKPWKSDQLIKFVDEGVKKYMKAQGMPRLEHLAHNVTEHFQKANVNGSSKVSKKPIIILRREQKVHSELDKTADIGTSRYKLGDILGAGGTGTVYKAEDLLMGMPVAIKVLSSELAEDANAINLLKEEARIAMQLSHRHIVRLHNLEKVGGKYFLVMEYVEGRNLREILSIYGKLPLETVMQIAEVSADALSYAHRHGVIHKDLKPDNILLTEDGVLKIIDFGIAGFKHMQKKDLPIMGTPLYMSPEQIMGRPLSEKTDIYSLGIILCELITGHPPFDKPVETTQQRMAQKPHITGMPQQVASVLRKAIVDDENERWETVEIFAINFIEAASSVVFTSK